MVTSGFSIFDLLCYHLLRSLNHEIYSSKRVRSAGIFFKNICLFFAVIFSLLFIGGIYEMFFNFSFKSNDIGFYLFSLCFLTLTVSGIYLYIGYGKILSHLDLNFTDSIDNIGTGK